MSYEEKGVWIYLVVALGTLAGYATVVLGRADGQPLTEVAYVPPLLWAIGASILATVVLRVVVEVARPSETHTADPWDREINRRGEHVGGIVLAVVLLGPFALALGEADHFWIANAIYATYIVQAVTSSLVKVRAYRYGL